MNRFYTLLPSLEHEEYNLLESLAKDYTDQQAKDFAVIYSSRRKDPQTILLLALVGFLGIGGIHRFILEQPGMGVLYLLTLGICFIGTIVDIVNYKKLSLEYNYTAARAAAGMVKP
jgi:TM2 domain-containing membrane protein YozV